MFYFITFIINIIIIDWILFFKIFTTCLMNDHLYYKNFLIIIVWIQDINFIKTTSYHQIMNFNKYFHLNYYFFLFKNFFFFLQKYTLKK